MFLKIEKAIYKNINSVIYSNSNSENFYLNEIYNEIEKLENLINEVLELTKFINLNLTAIRKILKKFDKKFTLQKNPVALYFLSRKLNDSSSDLVYILQFKLIDESSAIIEKITKNLERQYLKKKCIASDVNSMREPLLKEMNISMLSEGMNIKNLEKLFKKEFTKLQNLIEKLDESNSMIRSNVVFWSLNSLKTEFDLNKMEVYKNVMVEYIEEEKILQNLLGEGHRQFNFQTTKADKVYKVNAWISLIHTFLFTMNGLIVLPSNARYLEKLNASPFLSGLILGMTPLLSSISTYLYSDYLNNGYKKSYFISLSCLLLGNFFYSFADYSSSTFMMGLGRAFVGLGAARVVNRRYLIENMPNRLATYYSTMYSTMTSLGMAAGPFLGYILFQIPEFSFKKVEFNFYTNPGWLSFILWIVFAFILFYQFNDHINMNYINNLSNNNPDEEIYRTRGESLSLEKSEKINNEILNMNRSYTSLDLLEKEIDQIIKEEEGTFSYLSKMFYLLSSILFTTRVSKNSLITFI